MPLFVPILRVLMLFLNVYDSYKTLKLPPVSSRHEGKPSIRALTQRKRDMKGCLAVWIVWCSITLYERFVESIISLFIPFYDEFKSLALLFLIVTRAKGAEPIYLHLIRPIIKPYTSTLDGILDLTLLLGDFILALSMYPIRLLIQLWHKRFGKHYEPLETEIDSQSEISQDTTSSELTPASETPSNPVENGNGTSSVLPTKPQHSRKSTVDSIREAPTRRSSADTMRGRAAPGPARSSSRPVPVPVSRPSATRQSSKPVPRSQPSRENTAGRSSTLPANDQDPSTSQKIWYPPPSAYVDEPAGMDGLPPVSDNHATSPDNNDEDSRAYPAFPSAYPVSPPPATSKLAPASDAYPPIAAEVQQGFYQSLQLQREPLDPGSVQGSSDQPHTPGIPVFSPLSPATDSAGLTEEGGGAFDTDDEDDEDPFNTTLRTPLPPMGNLRSHLRPSLIAAVASASSSVPSRSSALTSLDNGSLRTTSTDSYGMSATYSPVAIRGAFGRNTSTQARQTQDDDSLGEDDEPPLAVNDPASPLTMPSDMSDTMDEDASSIASSVKEAPADGADDQRASEEKRRKNTRTPSPRRPRTKPNVTGAQPTTRHTKSNSTLNGQKAADGPKRTSARLKTSGGSATNGAALKLSSRTSSQSTTDSGASEGNVAAGPSEKAATIGRRNKPLARR